MKLKTRLTSLDELNAVPEFYRGHYTPAEDGKSWLIDDEIEIEDVGAFKATNDRLLKQHKTAQEELRKLKEAVGDLDLAAAREALQRLHDGEPPPLDGKKASDEAIERRIASVRKELQTKITSLDKELQSRDGTIAKLTKDLTDASLKGMLGTSLIDARIDPKWFEYVQMKAERIWRLHEGQLVPFEGEDPLYINGKIPDMTTWLMQGLGKQKQDIFLPSTGSGANGGAARGTNGNIVLSKEQALDVATYRKAKAQADKLGVAVVTAE